MNQRFFKLAVAAALTMISTIMATAQQTDFSADMRLLDTKGQTETVKLYAGNQRLKLDRAGTGESGITSLIVDFDHQILFLLIPRSKVYLRIAGSAGMPFYEAAWLFRPTTPGHPCGQWISEAGKRGINLRCQRIGDETVNGVTRQKWEATSPEGPHGTLWYDQALNFVTRIQRTSKDGTQTGYQLENIQVKAQEKALFDPYLSGYSAFAVNRLLDVLTKVGEW